MKILPLVGSINRLSIRSTVDLPQPDGPISTTRSPAAISNDNAVTATVPSSYFLPTWSRVIVAAVADAGVRSTYVLPRDGHAARRRRGLGQPMVLVGLHHCKS